MKIDATNKLLFLLAVSFVQIAHAQTPVPVTLSLALPLDFQVFQRQTKTSGKVIIECLLETAARGTPTNLDKLGARFIGNSTTGELPIFQFAGDTVRNLW